MEEGEEEIHDQFELRRRHTVKRAGAVAAKALAKAANGDTDDGPVLPLVLADCGEDPPGDGDCFAADAAAAGEADGSSVGGSASQKSARVKMRFAMLRNMLRMVNVMDDPTALLPMKCGWLERVHGGVWGSS